MGIRFSIKKIAGSLLCLAIITDCIAYAEDHSRPERVDSANWRAYSEYLLEPIARYLDKNQLALFHDNSGTRKMPVRKDITGSSVESGNSLENGQKAFLNSQAVTGNFQGFMGLYRITHDSKYSSGRDTRERLPYADQKIMELVTGSKRLEMPAKEDPDSIESGTFRFIRFISPSAVRAVTLIHKTSLTDDQYEEQNKRFSPVFSSCRNIHPENNSDDVFRFPLSFEDMHFFTNSLHMMTYQLIASKELFVPVTRVQKSDWKDWSSVISSQICSSETFGDGDRVSFERAPAYQDSSGQRKNSYLVDKEKVYIIKATSVSPLSESAYSYYMVGAETFLPYYEIQYDHHGEERRLLVASWGYPSETEIKNPLLVSLHSYDLSSEAMATFELLAYTGEVAVDCFKEFYESVCPSPE